MNALSDAQRRVGGDPRGFSEYARLGEELAKLNHPACPPVEWARVERLCLTLFHANGVDLQTAAFFTLARGHLYGIEGWAQGIALLNGLGGHWFDLWPPAVSVRRDVLHWLLAQLPAQLRNLPAGSSPAGLLQLDSQLHGLGQWLAQHEQAPLPMLHQVRLQLSRLSQRLEQGMAMSMPMPVHRGIAGGVAFPEPLAPLFVITPPSAPPMVLAPKRRRHWPGYLTVGLTFALTSGAWWFASTPTRGERLADLPAQPVRLDSLMLFDAGSAALKPNSAQLLAQALAGIRAQPGWLIEISGHTDGTGDLAQNVRLSQARAATVRDFLQATAGIPRHCFAIRGLAATQPLAADDQEAGRIANRRVDIRLVPRPGACPLSTVPAG